MVWAVVKGRRGDEERWKDEGEGEEERWAELGSTEREGARRLVLGILNSLTQQQQFRKKREKSKVGFSSFRTSPLSSSSCTRSLSEHRRAQPLDPPASTNDDILRRGSPPPLILHLPHPPRPLRQGRRRQVLRLCSTRPLSPRRRPEPPHRPPRRRLDRSFSPPNARHGGKGRPVE